MRIVNLTPHELTFIGDDGAVIARIPPSGSVARVASTSKKVGEIDGIPVFSTEFGDVVGLPDPEEDTVYVASTLVAQVATKAGRTDVFSPAELVRDSGGNVVGCKGLQIPEGGCKGLQIPKGAEKLPEKNFRACARELREYIYDQINATGDEYLRDQLHGEWQGIVQTVIQVVKYVMRLPDLTRIREDNLGEAKIVADKVIRFLTREATARG